MPGKPSTSVAVLALALAACAPAHPPGPSEPAWSTPTATTPSTVRDGGPAPGTDDDGDGVTAWNDLCPDRAEDADDFEDDDGCPPTSRQP